MSWKHIRDSQHKACKDTTCCLCEQTITKGTTYILRIGTDCGGLITMKMHRLCEEVTQTWTLDDWEPCHDVWEFQKDLKVYIQKGNRPCSQ